MTSANVHNTAYFARCLYPAETTKSFLLKERIFWASYMRPPRHGTFKMCLTLFLSFLRNGEKNRTLLDRTLQCFSKYQQRAATYLIITYGSEKRNTKNGAADYLLDPSWMIVLDSSHCCFAFTIPEASQANSCAFNSSLVNNRIMQSLRLEERFIFPLTQCLLHYDSN